MAMPAGRRQEDGDAEAPAAVPTWARTRAPKLQPGKVVVVVAVAINGMAMVWLYGWVRQLLMANGQRLGSGSRGGQQASGTACWRDVSECQCP